MFVHRRPCVGRAGCGFESTDRRPRGWGFVRGLFALAPEPGGMKSTRKGLRNDELYKDTYQRLNCAECEKTLATENPPDEVYNVRKCPDCEKEWKELP